MNKALYILPFLILMAVISCDNKKGLIEPKTAPLPANACDSIRYTNAAKFILDKNCGSCHSGPFPNGGFDLTTYNTAKVPATTGRISDRITNANNPMPPFGLMPQDKVDSLMCWINKGAPQ